MALYSVVFLLTARAIGQTVAYRGTQAQASF